MLRVALLAICVVLPASAFLLGCGGHGQSASTTTTNGPIVETAMPTTTLTHDHQPPPRTPEQ